MTFKEYLHEVSMTRFVSRANTKDVNFVMISAEKTGNSRQLNNTLTKKLANELKAMREKDNKISWIQSSGRYLGDLWKEAMDNPKIIDPEFSFIVFGIKKDDAIKLGTKYEQETILWKDNESARLIVTTGNNIGDESYKFNVQKIDKTMTDFFTMLKRTRKTGEDIPKFAYDFDASSASTSA